MNTGPLFPKLTECQKKIIILQGGGDSGKTTTALQFFGIDSIQQPGSLTTVTAQDIPNIKGGALRTFQRYVLPDLDPFIADYNKSDRIYTFKNKSILEFKSFDDEQDARGSERDNLLMNEANSQSYAMFWQLQRKTRRRIICDYNPTSPFWIHERILSGAEKQFADKYQLYITDHRHNPFLTQEEHESYESISDPDLFRVYARGLTGKMKGLILGHFKKCDGPPEEFDRIIWGGDWGYTNDPTAIVKIWVKGRARWGKEICYRPGIPPEEISQLMLLNGYKEGQPLYCDPDPNMVNQLRRLRISANPAIKGPGAEMARISKAREHDWHYFDSPNLEKELMNYKFIEAEDIVTGKTILTNQPMKGWDHACDACTYADYTDSFRHSRIAA